MENIAHTYNEIMKRAIVQRETGYGLGAVVRLEGESAALLKDLHEENDRRLDDVLQKLEAGSITEPFAWGKLKLLTMIDEYLRARALVNGIDLGPAACVDLAGIQRKAPSAPPLPEGAVCSYFESIACKGMERIVTGRRVIGKVGREREGKRIPIILCRCACGEYFLAKETTIIHGGARYCRSGCAAWAKAHSGRLLRHVWQNMIARCTDPRHMNWSAYGGRGIRVCTEWLESFDAFSGWAIKSGYRQGLTIDREDNDGDYTPENCRWATMEQQANNRRSCIVVTYGGQSMTLKQAVKASGFSYETLKHRYHAHGEAGLFAPPQRQAASTERR